MVVYNCQPYCKPRDSRHPRFEPLTYGQKVKYLLRKFTCADENRLTRVQPSDCKGSNRRKSPWIKEKHQLSLMFIQSGSGGRDRTCDHLLTLVPKFPLGADYIITPQSRGRGASPNQCLVGYSLSRLSLNLVVTDDLGCGLPCPKGFRFPAIHLVFQPRLLPEAAS